MQTDFTPRVTVFHCVNSIGEAALQPASTDANVNLSFVEMACSSMVKDVFLLRAFEAGADAVLVFVCPEGRCRYVEGNLRAGKRVAWVQGLLEEIGIGGKRLALFNLAAGDTASAGQALAETLASLRDWGPNPAA